MKSLSRIFLAVVLCFGTAISANADYIQPGDVAVRTENYQPTVTNFSEGTYRYEVTWQGIPVAKAYVDVKGDKSGPKPLLRVKAGARTASFIDVFYRLRHTSESVFEAQSLRPHEFLSKQKENSREKMRKIVFEQNGNIQAKTFKNGKQSGSHQFKSENLTLDPISAAFVARSLPIELGRKFDFDVFNGKHRYLISFQVENRELIWVNGRKRDAFRVVPSVQKLTDSEGEKRLKSATIWVSADSSREVLQLKSKVLVGAVSARLVGFDPEGRGDQEPRTEVHARLPRR